MKVGMSALVCIVLTYMLIESPEFIGFCNDDLRNIKVGDNALEQSKNCSLGSMKLIAPHGIHSAK